MGNALGQVLGFLLLSAIVCAVLALSFGGYILYHSTGEQIIESKTIVEPDYRLEANGKKIDTVYIYKFK